MRKSGWVNKIFFLFPSFMVVLVSGNFVNALFNPSWQSLLLIPTTVYLLPLAIFRLFTLIFPLKNGLTEIKIDHELCPWFVGIKIQLFYISFPFFEKILLLLPGVFSLWLRLWGSKIGRGIFWDPHFEISDRSHLIIGDGCLIGYKVYCGCHFITIRNEKPYLYLKPITIGDNVLIGGFTKIGPGAVIDGEQQITAGSEIQPNQWLKKGNSNG